MYSKERYDIPFNPDELEYRIENSLEQKLKSFDYFINKEIKVVNNNQLYDKENDMYYTFFDIPK